MRRWLWAVAIAAAYCGFLMNCAATKPVWVPTRRIVDRQPIAAIVCVDVSPRQWSQVSEAVEAWNEALRLWQPLIVVQQKPDVNCDFTIQEIEPDPGKSITVLASTAGLGIGRIQLYRGRYEVDPFGITLHEMGHALGARHLKGTLMDPTLAVGVYRCPDVATVLQVSYANSVDPDILSWCRN